MKIKRNKRLSFAEWILVLFLAVVLGWTVYITLFELVKYDINSDVNNQVAYMRQSWEEKNLFPEGFMHCNDTLLNRPVLIYWLFWVITNNYMLSFQLSKICTIILTILSYVFLMKTMDMKRPMILFALCMYFVWLPDEIRQGNIYPDDATIISIVALFTLGCRLKLMQLMKETKGIKNRKAIIIYLIMLAISAYFGFTTSKLMMGLYLPMFLLDGIKAFVSYKHIHRADQRYMLPLVGSFVLLVVNLAFYGILIKLHGDILYYPGTSIRPVSEWFDATYIASSLQWLFELVGLRGGGKISSFPGVIFIFSICFTVLILFSWAQLLVGSYSRAVKQTFGDELSFKLVATDDIMYFCIVSIITCGILMFLTGMFATRYYFVACLLLPILCGCAIERWSFDSEKGMNYLFCGLATFGLVAWFSTNTASSIQRYRSAPSDIWQVAQYIDDGEYEYVSGTYWNTGIINGMTNGRVDYQHFTISDRLNKQEWLIDKNKFENRCPGVPNILLLTDEEEKTLLDSRIDSELLTDAGIKVAEIGVYNLYEYSENPYFVQNDLILKDKTAGLPVADVDEKTDMFYYDGFVLTGASINSDGELVTNGTENSGFCGPYSPSVKGRYDITLYYVVDASDPGETGSFDVALDAVPLASVSVSPDQTSATIENVYIEEGHSFETRMFVPEGMIVRAEYIQYERLD